MYRAHRTLISVLDGAAAQRLCHVSRPIATVYSGGVRKLARVGACLETLMPFDATELLAFLVELLAYQLAPLAPCSHIWGIMMEHDSQLMCQEGGCGQFP